jgi:hypothetical protein
MLFLILTVTLPYRSCFSSLDLHSKRKFLSFIELTQVELNFIDEKLD